MTNSDAVALSSPALDLQMLKTAIEQLPEINAARVVDLHHRIIASEYKIDARQLAKKMLALGEAGLKDYIKSIGLFNTKAKHVIELSQMLIDDFPTDCVGSTDGGVERTLRAGETAFWEVAD